jgi:hypothetical protein
VQRFSYRQIMYYICFKAMIEAVRGARHGWRKLDRTGSVTVTPALADAAQAAAGDAEDKSAYDSARAPRAS